MRVMTRLQNITYVQTLLEKALAGEPTPPPGPSSNTAPPDTDSSLWCFPGSPGYVPPAANFDGDATDASALGSAAPANRTKRGTQGTKCSVVVVGCG